MKHLLFLCTILVLFLTACGNHAAEENEPTQPEKQAAKEVATKVEESTADEDKNLNADERDENDSTLNEGNLEEQVPMTEETPAIKQQETGQAKKQIKGNYKTITRTEQMGRANFSISYPTFNIKPLDQEIEQLVTKKFNEYVADNEEMEEIIQDADVDVTFSFELDFEEPIVTDSFISIEFNEYTYSGGAHGNYMTIPINYDTKNSKIITLQDVLQGDKAKLKSIADFTYQQLAQKEGLFMDQVVEKTTPNWGNFSSFLLTEEGIVIQFQPYEVGPFAAGLIEVEIPYSQIQ